MASIAARQVAQDVLGKIGKGEKPNVTKLAIKRGYSPTTADKGIVQKTKTYQATIKPFIEQLEVERQRAIDQLAGKIDEAKYRDLVDAIDKITKNHQLLTGGSTANVAVKPILGGQSTNGVPTNNSTEEVAIPE